MHRLCRVSSINHNEEMVGSHLVDKQVVDSSSVGVEHHAIVNLVNRGICDVIGENVVDIFFSVRSRHDNLSHVGDVKNATMLPHCIVLIYNRCVLDGHIEAPKWLNEGSCLAVPLVETCSLIHRHLCNKVYLLQK